jgi:hypothetical protein
MRYPDRFALTLVIALVSSLATAQSVSPALPLSTPVIGRVTNTQRAPAAATIAGSAFVVWQDLRDDRTFDLYGARVTASVVLDRPSLALVRGPGNQTAPAIAASTSQLLVVYLDDAIAACGPEVMGQRFDPTGQPKGSPIRLSTGACGGSPPSVAWNKASGLWLVTWAGHGASSDVHGALVAADGSQPVPEFTIAAPANTTSDATVTATTSGFMVAWADDSATLGVPLIYVALVSAAGTPGPPGRVGNTTAGYQRRPALSDNGSTVVVTWADAPTLGGSPTRIRAVFLTELGVQTSELVASTSTTPVDNPAVSPLASGWLISWEDARRPGRIVGAAVDWTGTSTTSVLTAGTAPRAAPSLTTLGTDTLLVCEGDSGDYVNGLDIFSAVVSVMTAPPLSAPVALPAQLVSTSATRARHVAGAFDGVDYLVSWRDDGLSFAGADLMAQRLAPVTGAWRGPDAGLRLTTDSAILNSYPSVAANDAGFFVSWGDHGSGTALMGLGLGPTGAPTWGPLVLNDVVPFVIEQDAHWLTDSWVTVDKAQFGTTLGLRRTAPSGATAMSEVQLLSVPGLVPPISTATSGDTLLVVFTGAGSGTGAGADILGALWRNDAGLLTPTPLPLPGLPGDQSTPTAAGGPSGFLVAWRDAATGHIAFAPFGLDGGALATPTAVTAGSGTERLPALGWTGASYLLVWARDTELVGVRVSAQGAVLDPTPFSVSASSETQLNPRVVPGPDGEALVTYEAFDPSSTLVGIVARARVYTEGLLDAGAASDAGTTDAGAADAGLTDAGAGDAGTLDAGVGDAGGPDGGSTHAGTPDAGPGDDGGHLAPQQRALAVGCGCQAIGVPPGLWLVLLVVAVSRRPERRSRRERAP